MSIESLVVLDVLLRCLLYFSNRPFQNFFYRSSQLLETSTSEELVYGCIGRSKTRQPNHWMGLFGLIKNNQSIAHDFLARETCRAFLSILAHKADTFDSIVKNEHLPEISDAQRFVCLFRANPLDRAHSTATSLLNRRRFFAES